MMNPSLPAAIRADLKKQTNILLSHAKSAVAWPSDLIGLIVAYGRQSDVDRFIDVIGHFDDKEYDEHELNAEYHQNDDAWLVTIHPPVWRVNKYAHQWIYINECEFEISLSTDRDRVLHGCSLSELIQMDDSAWRELLGFNPIVINYALTLMYTDAIQRFESIGPDGSKLKKSADLAVGPNE